MKQVTSVLTIAWTIEIHPLSIVASSKPSINDSESQTLNYKDSITTSKEKIRVI